MGFVGIHTMISENEEREKRRGFGAERNVRGYQHLRKMKIYKRKSEGVIREVGGKAERWGVMESEVRDLGVAEAFNQVKCC